MHTHRPHRPYFILFHFLDGRITLRMYELYNLVQNQTVYHLQQVVSLFETSHGLLELTTDIRVELVACPRTAR